MRKGTDLWLRPWAAQSCSNGLVLLTTVLLFPSYYLITKPCRSQVLPGSMSLSTTSSVRVQGTCYRSRRTDQHGRDISLLVRSNGPRCFLGVPKLPAAWVRVVHLSRQ
jgi:hypothetical protein